jgi:hypothetical protein
MEQEGSAPRLVNATVMEQPMLERERYDEITRLRRKARSIELEAGRAAPTLARQLRSLAAHYEAEAEELDDLERQLDS